MGKPKVVGINLYKGLIFIHYVEDGDSIVDERIAAVKWKANPTLRRLVQAFAEAASQYIIGGNKSIEKLESIDLDQLFRDLLDDESTK